MTKWCGKDIEECVRVLSKYSFPSYMNYIHVYTCVHMLRTMSVDLTILYNVMYVHVARA